ncbi:phospholipase [Deinococcus sp. KNUC1210]|uniref:phospholipase A2 n=1 Tax=Deinococcus sp. KNUC1210 TaxID=2917691 RepID=UPI001EF0C3FE|nr:phospholipase A2 [Deinococcus sp. KNUC1210]ULH16405.1 phospholipase [Deinococcus sp. KNUC1210]
MTTGLLAACGQQSATPQASAAVTSPVSQYQSRPELQDADSQAILKQYANDPGLLEALQTAYGERPARTFTPDLPRIGGLSLTADRLAYVKSVGWGSVPFYDGQYAAYAASSTLPYPGLDWSRDGCSAPDGLGLGYREDFRPACNVHDFGYRNLKVYERTDANRKTTDEVFHGNMDIICAAKSWYKRPACYAASYAYYQGVRIGGASSF